MKEAHTGRKVESESVAGDFVKDREGSETLVVELLGGSFGGDVLCVKPNAVSNLEIGGWESASIGRPLVLGLGDSDLLSAVFMEFGEGFGEVVGSGIGDRDIERKGGAGIVTIVGEKRGDLGGGVGSVVRGELGNREQVGPIVLLVVSVHAKENLQRLIGALGLPISFGMVRCRVVELDPEELAERRHELGGEGGSAIGNDVGGDTVLGEDVSDIEPS